LFLLDTNVPENTPEDRRVTAALYGGDRELRMQQEIVLGSGDAGSARAPHHADRVPHERRALRIPWTGADPHVDGPAWSAVHDRRQVAAAGNLFTTHTPVPAGFDRFEPALLERYFRDYAQRLGLTMEQLLAFGRQNPQDAAEPLNMAYLAARHSACANGVSRLHGEVTRKWPSKCGPGSRSMRFRSDM